MIPRWRWCFKFTVFVWLFIFFQVYYMLRFDGARYLSLLFKFILSERLSDSLWGSDVLLFSEFTNLASILFYNFIEFIILLYTFLVILFAQYKECIIWWITFINLSDVLPAFTYASAIGNLWRICLGVNILNLLTSVLFIKVTDFFDNID